MITAETQRNAEDCSTAVILSDAKKHGWGGEAGPGQTMRIQT